MSFQTCSSSEHIFDEFRELSDAPIDSKNPTTIKVHKHSKDIVKTIHETSGPFSERRLSENSEFVNLKWGKLGFSVQNGGLPKPGKAG